MSCERIENIMSASSGYAVTVPVPMTLILGIAKYRNDARASRVTNPMPIIRFFIAIELSVC